MKPLSPGFPVAPRVQGGSQRPPSESKLAPQGFLAPLAVLTVLSPNPPDPPCLFHLPGFLRSGAGLQGELGASLPARPSPVKGVGRFSRVRGDFMSFRFPSFKTGSFSKIAVNAKRANPWKALAQWFNVENLVNVNSKLQ